MLDKAKVEQVGSEKQPRFIQGVVASNGMNKTIVVKVEVKTAHPVYGKFVKTTTKYYAHDENNVSKVGDVVRIKNSRPLSKLKRWVLEEVVNSPMA